jgi:nucleotide-binding universal stress UspA family protein
MPGIIVGIDGSAHSHRALEWAISEATARHAALTVLTVEQVYTGFWGPAGHPFVRDASFVEQAAKEAQVETDHALAILGAGIGPQSVAVRAVTGLPAEEILKAARDADMIVVGSRGAGGFRKLLMGSVSEQVTHHAHCPVVVIPDERTSLRPVQAALPLTAPVSA